MRVHLQIWKWCFFSGKSQQRYWTQKSVCAPERAFGFHKSETGSGFCFPPQEQSSCWVPRAERLSHPSPEQVHSQSSGWEKSERKKTTTHTCGCEAIPVILQGHLSIGCRKQMHIKPCCCWCYYHYYSQAKKKKTVSERWRQIYNLRFVVEVSPVGPNLQKWQRPRR